MDIRVKTVRAEKYDEGFPPESLLAFQQWVNAQVLEVPEEHRRTAIIQWYATDDNSAAPTVAVEIEYRRPETVAEQEERVQTAQSRRAAKEAQEKLEYIRLRAKYEVPEAEQQALRVLQEVGSRVIAQVDGGFGGEPT